MISIEDSDSIDTKKLIKSYKRVDKQLGKIDDDDIKYKETESKLLKMENDIKLSRRVDYKIYKRRSYLTPWTNDTPDIIKALELFEVIQADIKDYFENNTAYLLEDERNKYMDHWDNMRKRHDTILRYICKRRSENQRTDINISEINTKPILFHKVKDYYSSNTTELVNKLNSINNCYHEFILQHAYEILRSIPRPDYIKTCNNYERSIRKTYKAFISSKTN